MTWTYNIPGAPRTKKNSQCIRYRGRTPYIAQGKAYIDYAERALWLLGGPGRHTPIASAVNVCCLYYMDTRRRVDLVNLLEATCDILVQAGILADDNSRVVVSHDGSRVLYDKENPRVEIEITEVGNEK